MASKRGNGEGTIYKRKDGKWQGQVTTGRDDTGKLKRVTFSGKTRHEVSEKMANALTSLQKGEFIEPNKVTLGQWLETWLWEYKKSSLRANTFSSYEQHLRVHIQPTLGHIMLKELRPETIQVFYNDKLANGRFDGTGGLSAATIKKINNILSEALDQAVKNQLIFKNVCEHTVLPRLNEKEVVSLTIEEQRCFMKAIKGDRLESAFLLALSTGLRIGELLGLRWKDVDFDEGFLRVNQSLNRIKVFDKDHKSNTILSFGELKTKSGKRSIPIPSNVITILKFHKSKQLQEKLFAGQAYEKGDLVFCTELGKPLEPRNLMRKFYSIIKKAQIKKTNFHVLRHTFASRALENGIHPKVVQEILGHSDISMTLNTYSHVMPEIKTAAAEKINKLFEDILNSEDKKSQGKT